MKPQDMRVLIAIGSRSDRICSVGAFARAEAQAFRKVFGSVDILEPTANDLYPLCSSVTKPDAIIFHAPSLHDRRRPWNVLLSMMTLRRTFPRAVFIPVVHEFSEAPLHWRMRQAAIILLSRGVIVNSTADFAGVRRMHAHLLKAHLGPTLFMSDLLSAVDQAQCIERLIAARASARAELSAQYGSTLGIRNDEKWILHPGLLTPGKGVNFLGKLAPYIGLDARLIIMGGMGPKQRDRDFACQVLKDLRGQLNDRLTFIDSPPDKVYSDFLVASDLVVLPYDVGVSERRSSFLSAMCCGANIWTTSGEFTAPLAIGGTGVHTVAVEKWEANDLGTLRSVPQAIAEQNDLVLERRLKNLRWASGRTWERRSEMVANFVSTLAT